MDRKETRTAIDHAATQLHRLKMLITCATATNGRYWLMGLHSALTFKLVNSFAA
jgi:hypothetical protein